MGKVTKSSINSDIGLRARAHRQKHDLKLQHVADAAEISKGHLSRFERGEKALSVSALIRLAAALDCTVGALTGEDFQSDDYHLLRTDEQSSIISDGYQYAILSAAASSSQHSTLLLNLVQEKSHESEARHAGRELLYIVAGKISLRLHQTEFEMNTGDYIEFAGHLPHEVISISEESTVLLTVIKEGV